ncbi:MAG: class I SAM-dependent methyltransferase [Phycisphaerales bacterium]
MGVRQSFYADPKVYDVLHTSGTALEVDGLERIQHRFVGGRSPGVWLEPACGTGRYLRVAAGRGRRVVGFDASEEMVEYTRSRLARLGHARRASVFVSDMTRFADRAPWRADLAFNLINTIRHLETERSLRAHLREVARALKPDGVYVIGMSVCAYGVEMESEDVWRARRGGLSVTQIVQYLPAAARDRVERVVSHMIVKTSTSERRIDSAYSLRAYSQSQWLDAIAGSAMRLEAVVEEDGHDIEAPISGYALYVLRPA